MRIGIDIRDRIEDRLRRRRTGGGLGYRLLVRLDFGCRLTRRLDVYRLRRRIVGRLVGRIR
jgi:hypothetical protein